jgi:uncharacterized protein (TIGR00369 family)
MNETNSPSIADDVRAALNAQGFLHLVGVRVDEVAPGRVTMSIAKRPEVLQQHGFFHGGVIGFLIDNSSTAAAGTLIDRKRQDVITVEYKVNFLTPAKGDELVCVANVVRQGRTLTIVEAKVCCNSNGEEKLVAVGLATIANLTRTPPLG